MKSKRSPFKNEKSRKFFQYIYKVHGNFHFKRMFKNPQIFTFSDQRTLNTKISCENNILPNFFFLNYFLCLHSLNFSNQLRFF